MRYYLYLGDAMTSAELKGQRCRAVLRDDGRCIRSPISTMLVEFEGGKRAVVLARRLRKLTTTESASSGVTN